MALISGIFPALSVGRFAAGDALLVAGGMVFIGYSGVPHLVEYYRPTATHCIDLVPRAAGAEPVIPRAAAGLLLSPRSASARVEGP